MHEANYMQILYLNPKDLEYINEWAILSSDPNIFAKKIRTTEFYKILSSSTEEHLLRDFNLWHGVKFYGYYDAITIPILTTICLLLVERKYDIGPLFWKDGVGDMLNSESFWWIKLMRDEIGDAGILFPNNENPVPPKCTCGDPGDCGNEH